MDRKNIYTVGQVNAYVRNMFMQDYLLQLLQVKGETSNVKYHSSGHIYFTLKDEKGTIACVMFAGNRKGLPFTLSEGQQVIVSGSIDVYERDGRYQLYAKEIEQDGYGLLYEKFDRLKRELADRGMFDVSYKQPIPKYIRTLGVVTAPTGAAVRDIINIASRRNPYVQIILYPALVQGEAAAVSIVNGIHALERIGVDTIIIGRGGGSIEDLWAFNEEITAQAVFDCTVPVISAVGHETDTTIADYAADLRAPTPSAAAELAVADIHSMMERLENMRNVYGRIMINRLQAKRAAAERTALRMKLLSPAGRIRDRRMNALKLEEQIQEAMKQKVSGQKQRLALYAERMKGLSPLERLSQGLAYVTDENGGNISDVKKVSVGDKIAVRVKNGQISARVTELQEWNEQR